MNIIFRRIIRFLAFLSLLCPQLFGQALNTSRYSHSATLLNNGQVLIAGGVSCDGTSVCIYLGSAEIFDPATSSFATTGALATPRTAPAVLLPSGKVLIAGGYTCDATGNCNSLSSAELYDPGSGTFTSAGNMIESRAGHSVRLLNDGRVLIAAGKTCASAGTCTALKTAEIYDPVINTFRATGALNAARFDAAADLLDSGQVLISGGTDGSGFPAAAELYDPSSGVFAPDASLNSLRFDSSSTLLDNGQVLVAGGSTCVSPGCPTSVSEAYSGSVSAGLPGYFSYPTYPLGGMTVPRWNHTSTLLTNGQVLLTGGFRACAPACTADGTTETFDPFFVSFASASPLTHARSGHTATMLANGSVVLIGGINNGTTLSDCTGMLATALAWAALGSFA